MVETCAIDTIKNVNKRQGVKQKELLSDFAKEKTKKTPHLLQKIKKANSRGKGVLGANIKSSINGGGWIDWSQWRQHWWRCKQWLGLLEIFRYLGR